MATNSGGYRKGSVKSRTQLQTPSGNFVKRNTTTGRFTGVKTSSKEPYKGVAHEVDNRRK